MKNLTLTFVVSGKTYQFMGLTQEELQPVTAADFHSLTGQGYFLHLQLVCCEQEIKEDRRLDTQTILDKFSDIFGERSHLPPQWKHDHAITLKVGAEPVSICLYHYPQYQKAEIEKMVRKYLDSEVIYHSISLFSTPML